MDYKNITHTKESNRESEMILDAEYERLNHNCKILIEAMDRGEVLNAKICQQKYGMCEYRRRFTDIRNAGYPLIDEMIEGGKGCKQWRKKSATEFARELINNEPTQKAKQKTSSVKNRWINAKTMTPVIEEGKSCSDNVFGLFDDVLFVVSYMRIKEDGDEFFVWADCNGDIYGDPAYFGDDFIVEYWQHLPSTEII